MRRILMLAATAFAMTATDARDLNAELREETNPVKRIELLEAAAASDDPQARWMAKQRLAFELAQAGEHARAEQAMQLNARLNARSEAVPDDSLVARPAVDAIVARAASEQVVMINEAHHVARTRWLTLSLLAPLRRQGFTHLALEALYEDGDALQKRGHAQTESGYYLQEPVFAELVREALRLGYQLHRYEYQGDAPEQQARETGQAENLHALLRENPKARVLVHAGYAHIYRNDPASLFGVRTMVEEFERLSGVRALTVEQSYLFDRPDRDNNHPAYERGWTAWQRDQGEATPRPFVLLDATGTPWSMKPDVFDISVFLPVAADGAWRSLDGRHRLRTLPDSLCAGQRPCLLEARHADEPAEALPVDRQWLENGEAAALWLPPGCFRLRSISRERAVDDERSICFEPAGKAIDE
ncbi:MAG TPA: hypothetical protein VFY12_03620 [Arenimonas sp.]|nr:hypothetical protein [Arenimonas sp.]